MRSRSSRLFIVLLHLVGVRTNLPLNSSFWKVGIVGVHPIAIVLEDLKLDPKGGLDGLLKKMPKELAESILGDPYWLQDAFDGRCLGPAGFSECGDATLWILRRRNLLPSIPEGDEVYEDINSEYAFQLLENNLLSLSQMDNEQGERNFLTRRRKNKDKSVGECLTIENYPFNIERKTREESNFKGEEYSLRLVSCRDAKAWRWVVDGNGSIRYEWENRKQRGLRNIGDFLGKAMGYIFDFRGRRLKKITRPTSSICVKRTGSNGAVAASCGNEYNDDEIPLGPTNRVVNFSLIRYQTNAHSADTSNIYASSSGALPTTQIENLSNLPISNVEQLQALPSPETKGNKEENEQPHTLPHTMRSSESNSKFKTMHPELKPMTELLFSPITGESITVSLIKESNPLSMSQKKKQPMMTTDKNHQKIKRPQKIGAMDVSHSSLSVGGNKQQILHPTSTKISSTKISSVAAPRKIPVHPYIKESINGVWKDPLTELEFLTDLSGYIGDDRKTHGRHTLMGVGQYTRTVFNIKVYGVALYVSKRDILADPNFIPFSSQEVTELQSNMELFDYLQKQINVDRSLFIKLNMQLGVDTMRSSLEADWKMLTEEHKNLLINCSMDPRPAEDAMLQKIKSEENSSRCSCGQTAPPEYNADMTCCARGTELVFTWRKSGALEVRVDGRLMDSFSIPGLATGIFFEYLRKDDPISMDALLNFAKGFPFLLAPLAQVKGASVGQTTDSSSHASHHSNTSRNVLFDFFGMVQYRVGGATSWVQANIDGTISNFAKGADMIKDASQTIHDVLDQKRAETMYHMNAVSTNTMRFVVERSPLPDEWKERIFKRVSHIARTDKLSMTVSTNDRLNGSASGNISEQWCHRNLLQGHYSCGVPPSQRRSTDRLFGSPFGAEGVSDEIGVIIHPNSNFSHRIFMYTVHLYLMLLLIVSLPESTNIRTRNKRNSDGKSISQCSSDDEYKEDFEKSDYTPLNDEKKIFKVRLNTKNVVDEETKESKMKKESQPRISRTKKIKKSLSYYL